jgi:hypothetical protein
MDGAVLTLHGGWRVWLALDSNYFQIVKVCGPEGKPVEVDKPDDPKIAGFPKFVRKHLAEMFGNK